MVPDPSKTSLGLEYFCLEGDALWTRSDEELIQLASSELERIGLCRAADVEDGCVVRVPKAYPVYSSDYRDALAVVREFVDSLENFRTIGRNGLHRYNNQDHAMVTGMLAVRSMVLGEPHDLWSVNTDQEYHEEVRTSEPMPGHKIDEIIEEQVARIFSRVDRVALGLATGVVGAVGLFVATLHLVFIAGTAGEPTLALLGQYFPGYSVSAAGAFTGLLYGFTGGFVSGWLFAELRNRVMIMYLIAVHRRWQIGRLVEYR